MGKNIVLTEKAPKPIGPYSQGVTLENDLMFVSGQLGMDPETGELAGTVEEQTRQSLVNMEAIVHAAGGTMANVLKTTIFLADMESYTAVNEIYGEFFTEDPPARSCMQVAALPKGALVEIECIARV